jgi:phosphate transport system permease protein
MSLTTLLITLLIFGLVAYLAGFQKAKSTAGGDQSRLHSRTGYYGSYTAIWTALPAMILVAIWSMLEIGVVNNLIQSGIAETSAGAAALSIGTINSIADGIRNLSAEEMDALRRASPDEARVILGAKGVILGSAPSLEFVNAAEALVSYQNWSSLGKTAVAFVLALAGFFFAYSRISPQFRARNAVESVIYAALWTASTIAILTTLGIVMSVLFETVHFFNSGVNVADFLFGTVWDPRFSSAGREGGAEGQFGLLPLLWGSLFISFVALLVAVPVGLMSAIYMAEYADKRFRAVAKPLLEVLAGIPTIVYGFFALVTFGPFLRDTGAAIGLDISANSVLTAGIVMGLMIIPYVSSLSDDIISAVPRSLRDGSFGLGATKSETIKKVVIPAALPGIVGAVLLAASRAIGETMIVVLAAGIAANLTINPLESVTTITVKIVSQLTGDLEFNSPQTLVAFALGLTLFAITLSLNIYALYIVRKYREQYE